MSNKDILDAILNLKNEIGNIKADIANVNNNLNQQFNEIKLKNTQLDERLSNVENRVEYFDKLLKRKNIIIYGIENNRENAEQLDDLVLNFMKESLKIEFDYSDIDFTSRMRNGNKNNGPIIVGLTTLRKKRHIFYNKKNLKGSRIYISDDLTLKERQKEKELIPQMMNYRKNGKHAVIKRGQLFVDGKLLDNQALKQTGLIPEADINSKKRYLDTEEDSAAEHRGNTSLGKKIQLSTKKEINKNKEPNIITLRSSTLDNFVRPRYNSSPSAIESSSPSSSACKPQKN